MPTKLNKTNITKIGAWKQEPTVLWIKQFGVVVENWIIKNDILIHARKLVFQKVRQIVVLDN